MSNCVEVPINNINGEIWLMLDRVVGKSGNVRAVKIEKSKKQVLDWDGHHCDEAKLKTSIRFKIKNWTII